MCQNFSKFRFDDFDVKDASRSGKPIEIDEDEIKASIEANRRIYRQRENLSNSTRCFIVKRKKKVLKKKEKTKLFSKRSNISDYYYYYYYLNRKRNLIVISSRKDLLLG